jgi:post-segregation antitoxin (ccd killing protein)
MKTARKITIHVPRELLDRAQRASGAGITQTIRTGLQLVAASHTYTQLRRLKGKVRFTRTWQELKDDR